MKIQILSLEENSVQELACYQNSIREKIAEQ